MKLSTLLAMVDEIRPNQISKQTKTAWLNEIEHRVADEVVGTAADTCPFWEFKPYRYDADSEQDLLAPEYYCDLYRDYLYAKIDKTLGEVDRYNNDFILFQQAWNDYAAWYRRHHHPRVRYRRAFFHGEIKLLRPAPQPGPDDPERFPGPKPVPQCDLWGVDGQPECFCPVLPCGHCTKATGNNSDTDNEA